AEDPEVAATRISVETLKGTVQLSGFATSETERQRAAQLARSVPDVREVRNDVIVRAPQ
ncbi:MAG TPA: BON domain-containing protein, partial [Burkholderiaceae bacterium]|nr:BON domain-containing protein [Burkholderiaceae bacterium]